MPPEKGAGVLIGTPALVLPASAKPASAISPHPTAILGAVRIDRVLIWVGIALLVVAAVLAAITWL